MQRPRFPGSRSSANRDQENVASQPDAASPDAASLVEEIDAGLATIEAALSDLERESATYRERLEGISGAARLFDEAGLVSEATAMHEGKQTIADALSENQRQRTEMTETARKLRAAREQLAPSGVDVIGQLTAAAARRELVRERDVGWHDNEAIADNAVPEDNQDTIRVASTSAPEQHDDSVSRLSIAPGPTIAAADPTTGDADIQRHVGVAAATGSPGRWRRPLVVVCGAFLLVLLVGGTLIAASMFGGGDDDSSSRSIVPAASATDVPLLSGGSTPDTSATPSAVAALVEPSPTSTELTALMTSPTPVMPTLTVATQATATTPPIPSTAPAAQPTAIDLGTVVERVIDAELALQTGQIDATMAYSDGTTATTRIEFDLGTPGESAQVAISTTYQSGEQIRTTEHVMIGAQVWERVDGGNWQEVNNVEGGWGQVQVFLPQLARVAEPQRESDDRPGDLRWYDSGRNADILLQVDPESGVPAQMRQVSRDTDDVLTITYTGWNIPIQIDPPAI